MYARPMDWGNFANKSKSSQSQLTPNYILVLFIVSTLASVWALVTLFKMDSVRRNAPFVAFIDLCFVGAFIAGVYFLRGITAYNCVNFTSSSSGGGVDVNGGTVIITAPDFNFFPFGVSANNTCAMLKASFALGIISVINFFNTAVLAYILHRRENEVVVEKTYRRSNHSSR